MKHDPAITTPSQQPERAVRVTLAYEGGNIRVLSRQVLAMRTPPTDTLQPRERESGFWFQVDDGSGNTLYRRVMENPVRFDAETITDDPRRPFKRVPLRRAAGSFFLLVPLTARAHTVRIFSSPFDPQGSIQPARQILEFPVLAEGPGEGEPEGSPGGPGGLG